MSLKLHAAPLVGQSNTWQQAYFQHNYGVVIGLNSTPTPEAQHQLVNRLNELLSQLQPLHLKQAVTQTLLPYKNQIINIGVCRILNHNNSISIYSLNTTVLLVREDQIVELIQKTGETKGTLQPGDKLALINVKDLESIGKQQFQNQLISMSSVNELADELQLAAHRTNDPFSITGLLIQAENAKPAQPVKRIFRARSKLSAAWLVEALRKYVHRNPRTNFRRAARRLKRLIHRYPLKSITFVIGIVTLFLLIRWITTPSISSQQVSESITMVQHNLEEGTALLELNRQRARSVLSEGEKELAGLMLNIKKSDPEYTKVEELLQKLQKAQASAAAAYEVKPRAFFELSLLRDNLTADELELIGNTIYTYSSNKQLIAELDIDTKASNVVAGGSWLIKANYLSGDKNSQYMLTDSGVNIIGANNQTVIETDEEWGKIIDLKYFGGNIYLLSNNGAIWKYLSAGDSFSSKRAYLQGDFKINNPKSMDIDGAIWVVSNNQILKFVGGRRDSYYIRDLEQELGDNMQLVKTPELDNIYILDNDRIIVLSENGTYKSQYSWKDPSNILDFAVSESTGLVYLLGKSTIYSFKLE